jgi:hypothetical protein
MNSLDRLRILHEKATPGNWTWDHNGGYVEGPARDDSEYYGPIILGTADDRIFSNAELIALSRNMLPLFLELVEKVGNWADMHDYKANCKFELEIFEALAKLRGEPK